MFGDKSKPLKSIIKSSPSVFKTQEDKKKSSTRSISTSRESHLSGYLQLGVPAFFGGSKKKQTNSSSHSHFSRNLGSVHSIERRPGQRVIFSDNLSVHSISAICIPSFESVQEPDGDKERQLQLQDIQDDPNYLPGFVDLYYATDITITEDTCCCSTQTSYSIKDDTSDKIIYTVEKETDGMCSSFLKFCCLRKFDISRVGFTIRIFNTTVSHTKLLTYKRKTHWFAEQLDIVETFYSIENTHVGRIEKTKEGYRLIDQRGRETYRVFREIKPVKKNLTIGGSLIAFCSTKKKAVAKITYLKRTCLGTMLSLFTRSLKHQIRWSSDIGVAIKTLLIGVLFLELHSIEKYVDLPLGRDANLTVNNTKHRRLSSYL